MLEVIHGHHPSSSLAFSFNLDLHVDGNQFAIPCIVFARVRGMNGEPRLDHVCVKCFLVHDDAVRVVAQLTELPLPRRPSLWLRSRPQLTSFQGCNRCSSFFEFF